MKNASGEREREDSKEPRRHSALQRRGPKEKQRKSLTSVETRGSTSTQTRRGWSGCRQNTNAGSFRESGGSGGPTRIISYHRLPDVMKGQLRKRLVVAPSLQFPSTASSEVAVAAESEDREKLSVRQTGSGFLT